MRRGRVAKAIAAGRTPDARLAARAAEEAPGRGTNWGMRLLRDASSRDPHPGRNGGHAGADPVRPRSATDGSEALVARPAPFDGGPRRPARSACRRRTRPLVATETRRLAGGGAAGGPDGHAGLAGRPPVVEFDRRRDGGVGPRSQDPARGRRQRLARQVAVASWTIEDGPVLVAGDESAAWARTSSIRRWRDRIADRSFEAVAELLEGDAHAAAVRELILRGDAGEEDRGHGSFCSAG